MKTLLIIESPGKKKTLQKILGDDFNVMASFGHIRDLPEKAKLPAAPDYVLHYEVTEDSTRTVDALRSAAQAADRVLLAMDPDREGEAIAWHLSDELGLADAQRVTYQEITATAVKAALAKPRAINMQLVRAQEARRGLDRLIGWKASAAVGNAVGETVSSGRVQSPALSLVVIREHEIRGFSSTQHFGATLRLTAADPAWSATWTPTLPAGQEYITDRAQAEQAANVMRVRVLTFVDTSSRAAPPPPFTTSTLQQKAQTTLKLKPIATMQLAQRLYEQGLITYMRTDTPNLSGEAFEQIAEYARDNQLPVASERRVFPVKAGAQEAHEAIRPTSIAATFAGGSLEEEALYALIWSRAVASQLTDAVYAVRTATLADADGVATYQAKSRTLADAGWRVMMTVTDADPEGDDEEGKQEAPSKIPQLHVGDVLDVASGEVVTKATRAPARYTLATLGKALEHHGIGRPSTYATILDTLTTRRGYLIEDAKGFLSPSMLAEWIVKALTGVFSFVELDYTRELEDDLDKIASGEKTYIDVVTTADALLEQQLTLIATKTTTHPCRRCGEPMRKRKGAKGVFWGCSAYPACTNTQPDADGTPGEPVPVVVYHCPECAHKLRRLVKTKKDDPKKKGYDFWACTGTPECRKTYNTAKDGSPILHPETASAHG